MENKNNAQRNGNGRCQEILIASDSAMGRLHSAMPAMVLYNQSLPHHTKTGACRVIRGIGEHVVYNGPGHADPGW